MGKDRSKFYASIRESKLFGTTLSPDELSGCEALLTVLGDWKISWLAYGLATAFHETGHTMKPVKEAGGPAYFAKYGRDPLKTQLGNRSMADGLNLYGRGYVQITGYHNYLHLGTIVGVDLVTRPDLALDPVVAGRVMKHGMEDGLFTGRSLKSYLPNEAGTHAEFIEARRIINGTDRADLIAGYADTFQHAILTT